MEKVDYMQEHMGNINEEMVSLRNNQKEMLSSHFSHHRTPITEIKGVDGKEGARQGGGRCEHSWD